MLLAAMAPALRKHQPYACSKPYHIRLHSKQLHRCRAGWSKLVAAALLLVACACASQATAQDPAVYSRMTAAQMAQALANPDPSGLLQREAEQQVYVGVLRRLHCLLLHMIKQLCMPQRCLVPT
jgi:hypothetical protein